MTENEEFPVRILARNYQCVETSQQSDWVRVEARRLVGTSEADNPVADDACM